MFLNTSYTYIHTYTLELSSQDNRFDEISIDPDAPELPPRLEEPDFPFTEPPPNYREVCDRRSNASAKETAETTNSNDTTQYHDDNTQADVRVSSDSTAPPKVTPIYDDVSPPKESSDVATTPQVTPIYDDVSAPKDSSDSVGVPKATSGYQDISELPEARQVLTNPEEHGVEEDEHNSSPHSGVSSVSANTSPLPSFPLYQEVHKPSSQRETPPLLTPELSPERHASPELSRSPMLVQEVLSSPRHYCVSPFMDTFNDSRGPFTANMPGYPQTHSYVSTPPLPPPVPPSYSNYSSRAPRMVLDEWEEYRIPPGGTLV